MNCFTRLIISEPDFLRPSLSAVLSYISSEVLMTAWCHQEHVCLHISIENMSHIPQHILCLSFHNRRQSVNMKLFLGNIAIFKSHTSPEAMLH